MGQFKAIFFLASLLLFGSSCAPTEPPLLPNPTPVPTIDPFFAAIGIGEPRSIGYWLVWNSCAPDNRAATAASNGGRSQGWILMDDLLEDPGILLGGYQLTSCQNGVDLLQGATDENESARLVAGLLAAQLNLATGAEYCPASDESVQAAQLLLAAAGFDGHPFKVDLQTEPATRVLVERLADQLATYNAGDLCR